MIVRHLKTLINETQRLIHLTQEDIVSIAQAKHEEVAKNHKEKELLIRKFESNKSLLNHALLERTKKDPTKSLEELLNQEEQEMLEKFRQELANLHYANKEYTKYVATFCDFFNSLVGTLFEMKTERYLPTAPKPAAFLKVSA